jgi:phospholipase/carboxylesterase
MHQKNIVTAGRPLTASSKVLIMLHGRGGSAEDIISLASSLDVADYTVLAPQATNNSWYPYSFLAPPAQNEPWLSSALALLKELLEDVLSKGIPTENIYFSGFSQGACLTLEFVARNANKYGGVAAFTGGLIGDKVQSENYNGDFQDSPVFIGTSDPDPHVPVERVHATIEIFKSMNAAVTEKVYKHMGHTISQDEIDITNRLIFSTNHLSS